MNNFEIYLFDKLLQNPEENLKTSNDGAKSP